MSGTPVKLSRRELMLLGISGTGLTLGMALDAGGQTAAKPVKPPLRHTLNLFVQIATDGMVTLFVPRAEVGQSVRTTLPMLIAEELDADWNMVRVQQAPVQPNYGPQETLGDFSLQTLWEPLRRMGATAREMLVRAAALEWKVAPDTCTVSKGVITHQPTGRHLTYGQLAKSASTLAATKSVTLKPESQFVLIGKSVKRRDTLSKVNGTAVYSMDLRLPGMLFAVVAHPPVPGSTVDKCETAAAKKVRGVSHVLQSSDKVAVVGNTTWTAISGRNALNLTWKEPDGPKESSDDLRTALSNALNHPGAAGIHRAVPEGMTLLEAEYELPFQAHAAMEPPNCTVNLQKDRCDLYLATQTPERIQEAAATFLKRDKANIHVHLLLGGGSFGQDRRRLVLDALAIAQQAGKPVKLLYTREDDLHYDDYRPASAHRIQAHLDAAKRPVMMFHGLASTPDLTAGEDVSRNEIGGSADSFPYFISQFTTAYNRVNSVFPRGHWRSGPHSYNAFAIESFMDELAAEAKLDPLAFRLKYLQAPATPEKEVHVDSQRMQRVLEMAAEKSGWKQALPARSGRGIACHTAFGSYCAQVVEVAVDADGKVSVKRVVCAVDCGRVVHPDTVVAQMEGGIAFGLTAALKSAITVENGQVMQANFNNYPIMRIDEMPQVEVIVLPSVREPGGVGEIAVPPVAPALCNALFAATGKRVRRLPVRTRELRQR